MYCEYNNEIYNIVIVAIVLLRNVGEKKKSTGSLLYILPVLLYISRIYIYISRTDVIIIIARVTIAAARIYTYGVHHLVKYIMLLCRMYMYCIVYYCATRPVK